MEEARRHAALNSRSSPKQIEYWSKIGKIAEEKPDLPYSMIRGIQLGLHEIEEGQLSEYRFDR